MNRRTLLAAGAALAGDRIVGPLRGDRNSVFAAGTAAVTAVVLGTAQDGGIPQAGCFCPNCMRARTEKRFQRRIVSLGLYDLSEGRAFILDATPDIRPQLDAMHDFFGARKKPEKKIPDGILISHAHIGHYSGLVFFGFESLNTKNLPIYGSERMISLLKGNQPWRFMAESGNFVFQQIVPDRAVALTPNLKVTPFLVAHRDELSDTLGFVIEGPSRKILYIPDISTWASWRGSFPDFVSQVDFAFLDGTFFDRGELPGRDMSSIGHPLVQESIELLSPLASKGSTRIFFTHFNHSNPVLDPESPARRAVVSAGLAVAEDGQEFQL